MKICHIISGDIWGGAEAQACQLMIDIAGMDNFSVSAILLNEGFLSDKLNRKSIPVHIIKESQNNSFLIIFKIFSFLHRHHFDVVHFHGFKENFLGGVPARLLRIKCLVRTHHGRGMMTSRSWNRYIEKINSLLLTDKTIAVSRELKFFLQNSAVGNAGNKINVVHNGINIKNLSTKSQKKEVLSLLNIPSDAIIIGTAGRMVREKAHNILLQSVKLIIAKGHKTVLVILGDGYLMDETMKLARDLNITDSVRFPGFVDNVLDYINIFDIFVMTSVSEGIPIALLEAMGLGKPIITTSVGGIPEVIVHNDNGMLVPESNSVAFADTCCQVIEQEKLRNSLSLNALKTAENNFSSIITAEKTCETYQSF